MISISVILPAFNEERNIEQAIHSYNSILKEKFNEPEIIVVCDGCTDNTLFRARKALRSIKMKNKLIEYDQNRGKGYAVCRGMEKASGDYRLYTDVDLSTPPETLESIRDLLDTNIPIIIGSRTLSDSRVIRSQAWYRRLIGKTFTFLANNLLGTNFSDFTCGFKVFRDDVAQELFPRVTIDGFTFEAELLYIAKKKGYSIKEIPVQWTHKNNSSVNPVSDSLLGLLSLTRIKSQDMFGKYL